MNVQLLFSPDCPNAEAAREALRSALKASGCAPRFDQVDLTAAGTSEELRGWGSPTILVNGRDVAGGSVGAGTCCRIYGGAPATDPKGVPPAPLLRAALHRARPRRRGLLGTLAVLPGALAALLPSAHCPFCLGAYGAVASSLGLGFVLKDRFLAPLLILLLVAGVAFIAWTSRSHRRLGPLLVTIAASVLVYVSRFVWNVPALVYGGGGLLFAASVWNLWLKRPRPQPLVTLRLGRGDGRPG